MGQQGDSEDTERMWRAQHGETMGTPWRQSGNSGDRRTGRGDCGDITDTLGMVTAGDSTGTSRNHDRDTLGKLRRPKGHLGHIIETLVGHLWHTLGILQGDHGDTYCTCVVTLWQLFGPSVHPHPPCCCHYLRLILVSPAQRDVGAEGARQEGWALRDTSHLWGHGETWHHTGIWQGQGEDMCRHGVVTRSWWGWLIT